MAADPRVLPAEEGSKFVDFMLSKSATRKDLVIKAAVLIGGAIGIGALLYFLFRPPPKVVLPTTQDVTNASSGVVTSGACAYLETTARNLDAQGVPLQSGLTRVELMTLVACGGPHAMVAKAWLDANPVVLPPSGGGGGGGGSARTQ